MSESTSSSTPTPPPSRSARFITLVAWLVAISLVLSAVYLGWRVRATQAAPAETPASEPTAGQPAFTPNPQTADVGLPTLPGQPGMQAITRQASLHTIIPTRPRQEALLYTVGTGDSVFGIAEKYGIMPETVLWANYDQLEDNPDMLSPGMELNIPPVNGVYYQWQEGDTVDSIAAEFKAEADDILSWPGNLVDLTNPSFEVGQWIMVPDGEREFQQWLVPTIARDNSGVNESVLGPGTCTGSYDGAYGSGAFAWPTASHVLSGNDYWSGHLGIDIAGSTGDGIFASDAGVVVFSGWALYGYGYMIMIDHGNGYQSLYAHLSSVGAGCGQSVYTGTYIGAMGSTGNSTGAHLHFEVRYLGGFLNPWYVLPAP